jgi:hypothetical protein
MSGRPGDDFFVLFSKRIKSKKETLQHIELSVPRKHPLFSRPPGVSTSINLRYRLINAICSYRRIKYPFISFDKRLKNTLGIFQKMDSFTCSV